MSSFPSKNARIKEFVRRMILSAGYELRHKTAATVDPFRQQKTLLKDVPAPVIFDVGANIGAVTEKYRCLFPAAKIYSFEPCPEVFSQLQKSVRGDRNITPYKLALGSAPASRVLRVNSSCATNSLLETADSAVAFWGTGLMETTATVEVDVATIDEFSAENEIAAIDALKIDTQGTELEILKGAAGMLREGRIRVIYTEMIVVPSYKGQAKPHELMGYLDGFGYYLEALYNLWNRDDGRLLQMDAVFVRGEHQ